MISLLHETLSKITTAYLLKFFPLSSKYIDALNHPLPFQCRHTNFDSNFQVRCLKNKLLENKQKTIL